MNSTRSVVALVLVMGLWLMPSPVASHGSRKAQGTFTPETFELDSHDNDDDGAAGPVATRASLETGVVYIVTVDGTFSTWDEATWENPGACGTAEPEPENPSSGTSNGPVSSDAEFLLAEPAWGGQDCNDPIPRHDGGPFQIDVGSGFVHQEPIGGEPSSPASGHTYQYRVTGRGVPAQFELVEDPTSDNYGVLTITVEAQPTEDDPPPQCGDEGAICGGSEDEELQGTPEDEFIFGGGGDDEIDGGGGNDIIVGGSGNDVITGGPGTDQITGGSGEDRIVGDAPRGSSSAVRSGVRASQEEPAADQLAGGGGNDAVFGGGGADLVAGGSGKDRILGEAGNDELKGDAGNDLLKGGGGVNDFNGGPGRDKCVLSNRRDETRSCEKKARSFARSFYPTKYLRDH
ncbi:MAG TPA: calcium-binding protein [Actinomycetota bacterium]|nr:calcium-binding protein [Actinomycetota bacterium]